MYSQLTVCANNITQDSHAVNAALNFAERFQATVNATYIKLGASEILRWQGSSPTDFFNQMLADIDKRERDAMATFERLSQGHKCEVIWRAIQEADDPIREMLCTDLFIASQPTDDYIGPNTSREFLNSLILETKRPVVMIPRQWKGDGIGKKILLAWNSSPEAMRAASDALPLMQAFGQVTIVDVLSDRMSRAQSKGMYHIQDYLNHKKVDNQLIIDSCERQSDIPKKLIERANEEPFDLMVIGGYGHSRIREVILGGVTDYLIKHSPVPVFFSH